MASRGRSVDSAHRVIVQRSTLSERVVGEATREHGYVASSVGMDRMSFSRSFRPKWATVTAILLSPTGIALFLLLKRSTESFSVSVEETHAGTTARIHGKVHPELLERLGKALEAGMEPVYSTGPGFAHLVDSKSVGAPQVENAAQSLFVVQPAPSGMPAPSSFPGQPSSVPPTAVPSVQLPVQPAVMAPRPSSISTPVPASPWMLPDNQVSNGASMPEEHTRMVSRPGGPNATSGNNRGLRLRLDDGQDIDLDRFSLIGRNPEHGESDEGAELIIVSDDTISKTHAAIGCDELGVWVTDRHSTNGTTVIDVTGGERSITPGERVRLEPGIWVRFGKRVAYVEAR